VIDRPHPYIVIIFYIIVKCLDVHGTGNRRGGGYTPTDVKGHSERSLCGDPAAALTDVLVSDTRSLHFTYILLIVHAVLPGYGAELFSERASLI